MSKNTKILLAAVLLLIDGQLLGIVRMLLAVPVTAMMQALLRYLEYYRNFEFYREV